MDVGFIGLGQMGRGMAASLLRAGHTVTVYNRSPDKTASLAQMGAHVAGSVEKACAQPVVITMLADDRALEEIALGPEGIVRHLPPGATHLSMSTVSVGLSRRLAAAHAEHAQLYVAAPVFGRPDAAAAGKLYVVVAADEATLAGVAPLLASMAAQTFRFEGEASAANIIKLTGNFLIASAVEAMAEALTLVGRAGVDERAYLDFLTATLFNAPVYKNYGGLIVEGRFRPPGFAAPLGYKDINLALEAANALRVPLPLASLLHDRLLSLLATEGEDIDWSGLALMARRDAGLPPL